MGLLSLLKKKPKVEQEPEKSDLQKAFEANLKYLSTLEKDAGSIQAQFVQSDSRSYVTIGTISCVSGHIVVADPLAYLPANRYCPTLEKEVPVGNYPVEVSICKDPLIGIRMCTVRMRIQEGPAVRYELAKPTIETAAAVGKEGLLCGFSVDAGMIGICDAKAAQEYQTFLNHWYVEHPDGNHYDDYFAAFFQKSEETYPQYQRKGGDFIAWENPETGSVVVMAASGFGDGFYQSYWGYDASNALCECIIPLIDPDVFGL